MRKPTFKLPKNARALGFEPRSKVLETSILPLNYARKVLYEACTKLSTLMLVQVYLIAKKVPVKIQALFFI